MSPIVVTAFGITGDLMRLKIIPAFFSLYVQGVLPPGSAIIGISRKPWADIDLREYIREVIGTEVTDAQREKVEAFLALFQLVQGDVQDEGTYAALKRAHEVCEDKSAVNHLWYLAIEPSLYVPTILHIHGANLAPQPHSGLWTRVMIEKPFGLDHVSAQSLQTTLRDVFTEAQIYRTDHYLAKETLQHLKPLLPANTESIIIRILETMGVEGRGEFYDQVGAFRDIGQSHLLLVLASLFGERTSVLQNLPVFSPEEVQTQTVRAQYVGYGDTPGVQPHSKAETYFTLRFILPLPHSNGVSVLLQSGKKMPVAQKEISITQKSGEPILISLTSGTQSEYMVLLLECIKGNQERFVSQEEVTALWRFVDPIETVWKTGIPPLTTYEQGAFPN